MVRRYSALTGLIFGLTPLRYLSERVGSRLLRDRTPGTTASGPWLRRALVAGEVALAVVLVVGAGLMVRTVVNLMNIDAGFERSRLVTFAVARRRVRHERIEELTGDSGNFVDCIVESSFVGLRRFVEATQLSHKLDCGRANLFVSGWWFEVVQGFDIATHKLSILG